MTTKTATTPRRPKPDAKAIKPNVFRHMAVEPLAHGVRVRPKAITGRVKTPAGPRGAAKRTGTVEVRLQRDAGSKAWRELVPLVTAAALDRLASVPESARTRLLADLRETLEEEGGGTASAEVLTALRRVAVDADADQALPAANRAALERAYARADVAEADLLKRPDMLTGEALAARTGLARATVDNRRKANQLLALELGTKRGVRYPAWQAELLTDAATRKAFEASLAALAGAGPWARYRFFVTPQPALAGRTPIEALKAGEGSAVAAVAATWAAGEHGGR